MSENKNLFNRDIFSKQDDFSSIEKLAITGGATSLITRALGLLMHFVSVIVLARLLSPDDFGVYAMASVFISIFFVFQDVGLTDATIQAKYLDHEILSTLFWINFSISTIIAVLLSISAPLAVIFFHRKELLPIILVSATEFIFWGLSFQHTALMKRNLLFTQVNVISIISYFFGLSIAIVAALLGMRYWSLVIRGIVTALTTSVMTLFVCKWRPGKPAKSPEVKSLIRFGINSVGYYLINYFSNNLDKAIIGKKFSAEQLGYYSRAFYIAVTPSSTVSQSLFHVAVSTLSKIREDKPKFRKYYYNSLQLLSLFGMPFAALMVILNKEIVYILLGPKWAPTAKYFAILGLSAGFNIIYQTSSWLHVSLGNSDRWLKWGMISSVIMISGFFIGLLFGMDGIAWAYSILIISFSVPSILYAGKPLSITLSSIANATKNHILASIISGFVIWQIKIHLVEHLSIILKIFFTLASFIPLYLSILIIFYGGINQILEPVKQIITIISKPTIK
jgi:PST family polysaccharide transporter